MKKSTHGLVLAASVAVAAVIGGCNFGGGKDTVATVGDSKITMTQLSDRLATFPPQYAQAIQQPENKIKILEQMIDEEVALEGARKLGFDKTDEVKKQIQNAERQILLNYYVREKIDKTLTVTEDELRAYYTNNSAQFQAAELRNLSHILVATREEAEAIVSRLNAGQSFESLAKEKSKDNTASNGGQLGWVQRGQVVPAFEQAAFSIGSKGGLSGVVQTQFGFHVIRLNDVQMRPRYEFEQVKEQIRQMVTNDKKRAKTTEVLGELKKGLKVKITTENIK